MKILKIVLLVVFCMFVSIMISSTVSGLEGFSNIQTISISPSADGTLTDYQISFDISYEPEMQTGFDDIRFTDKDGILLPYWIEEKINSSSAKVWVKVPEINGINGATVKMYYGNSTAVSKSDGEEVFEFFDDFSSSLDTDKWTTAYNTPDGGSYDVGTEDGKLEVSARGPSYAVQADAYAKTKDSFNFESTLLEIEYSADQVISSGEGAWWYSGFIFSNDTTMHPKYCGGHYVPDNGIAIRQPLDGYGSTGAAINVNSYVDSLSTSIYHTTDNPGSHKFNLIMDKENVTLYVDDVMVAENVEHNLVDYDSYIYFLRSSDQYIWNTQKWDYVIVRQHAFNEPTYIIAEESTVPTSLMPTDMDTYMQWYWDAVTDADSYNVSLSDGWHNGTVSNTINDTSVSAHGISTIEVFGYNETYDVLSSGISSYKILENNPITITNISSLVEVMESKVVNVDINFTDVDNDTATFGCNRTDLFTDFNTSTGIGSWTSVYGIDGIYTVLFNVTDGYGSIDSEIMTIIVADAPYPGIPTNIQNTTGNFNITWTWDANVAGEAALTDSYNISVYDAWTNKTIWTNETTESSLFMEAPDIIPHVNYNISVYAINNTYGTMSTALESTTMLDNNPVVINNNETVINLYEDNTIEISLDAYDNDIDYPEEERFANPSFDEGTAYWLKNAASLPFSVTSGTAFLYGAVDKSGEIYQNIDLTDVDEIIVDLDGRTRCYYQKWGGHFEYDAGDRDLYYETASNPDASPQYFDVSDLSGIQKFRIYTKHCNVYISSVSAIAHPHYDNLTYSCNRTDLFTDFNTSSGKGVWDAEFGDAGTYDVEFTVSDEYGSIDSYIVTYNVDEMDVLPATNLQNTTGNFWINWTWTPSDDCTDAYDILVKDTWYNDTKTNYLNLSSQFIVPHNEFNISVFAKNSSSGRLAPTSLDGATTLDNNPVSITNTNNSVEALDVDIIEVSINVFDPDNDEYPREERFANPYFDEGKSNWTLGGSLPYSVTNGVAYLDGTVDKSGEIYQYVDLTNVNEIMVDLNPGTYCYYQQWGGHIEYDAGDKDLYYTTESYPDTSPRYFDVSDLTGLQKFRIYTKHSDVYVTTISALTDRTFDDITFSCNRTDLFTDFHTSTGIGTWNTDCCGAGNYTIEFTADDGYGSTDSYIVTYEIQEMAVATPTNLQNTTGNFYANWAWDAGDIYTDAYNVLVNDVWYNDTPTNYINLTAPEIAPHTEYNISVFGMNSSSGRLSLESLNGSTMLENNPVTIADVPILYGDLGWVTETDTVTVNANFTDIDEDFVAFSCNRTDLFTVFDNSTGEYTWNTEVGDVGTYYIEFTVDDGYGSTDSAIMEVVVADAPYPDTATNLNYTTRVFGIDWDWDDAVGADSYNVYVDGEWYNGTATSDFSYVATTQLNVAKPHSSTDVEIYSYNETYGTLSEIPLTGTAIMPNNDISITIVDDVVELNDLQNVSVAVTYADPDNDDYPGLNHFSDPTVSSGTTDGWSKSGIGTLSVSSGHLRLNSLSIYDGVVYASQSINLTDVDTLSMRHIYSTVWSSGDGGWFKLDGSNFASFHTDNSNRVINKDVSGYTGMHTVQIAALGGYIDADDFYAIKNAPDYDTITYGCNRTDLIPDFDTSTGTGTFNGTIAEAGVYPVEFTVDDGYGSTDSYVITYKVSASHSVTITDVPTTITVIETESVTIDANASDLDNNTFTFSCNRTDLFSNFNLSDGTGTWNTNLGDAGTYYIGFGVDDNAGYTNKTTLEVIVEEAPKPDAPTNLTATDMHTYMQWDWTGSDEIDSYNVSLSDGWHNGTTNTINDSSISAHGNSTISVCGYNATYGLLSAPVSNYQVLANNPVTISGLTSSTDAIQLEKINVDVNCTDLDNDIVTFSCNRTDLFTDFNTTTGMGTWNTQVDDYGSYVVEFTVNDGYGSTDSQVVEFTIKTATPPDAPTDLNYTKGNFYINLDWNASNINGSFTDSYNISINGVWTNGTTLSEFSMTYPDVIPHTYYNIGIYSYNTTNNKLSTTSADISVILDNNAPTITNAESLVNATELDTLGINLISSDADNEIPPIDKVTNGGFTDGTTGWTNSGLDSFRTEINVMSSSRLAVIADTGTGYAYQDVDLTDIDTLQWTLEYFTSWGAGQTARVMIDDTTIWYTTSQMTSTNGQYTVTRDVSGYTGVHRIKLGVSVGYWYVDNVIASSAPKFDNMTYSCNRTDLFTDFNTSTGAGTWNTGINDAGTYDVEFSVDDGYGGTDSYVVTYNISDYIVDLPNGTTDSNISVSFLEPGDYSMVQAGDSIDFILEARDNTTKFNLDGFSGYVELEGPGNVSEQFFLSNVNGNLSGEYFVEESDPDGVWYATATVYNSTLVFNESVIFFKTGSYIIQSYAESSAYITGQDINFTAIAFSADNFSQYVSVDDLNMSLELYPYNNSTSAFGPVGMQYDPDSHEFGYTVNSGSIGQGIYTAIITGNDGNGNIENASMQIGVSDDFTVNVDVDSKYHDRAETVGIYGSAEYLDGTPMVNTSVSLLLDVDGFQRSYTVITNEAGNFTYDFEPLSNEAGTYLLDAYVTNNGIGRSANTDFVIYGLRLSPISSTVDMCENSTHGIQLELSNLGDTTLTGLFINLTDTDPADNVALVLNGSLPSELTPDESVPIWLNIEAGSLVTENSTFEVHIFSNQTECTANLTVNLFSDTPVLECQPENIEAGLNKNQTATKTMTLYNSGYGNLENVTLQYSGSQWFTITTDTHLGNIPSGENFSFDINLNSYNVGLGTYNDTVRVISDNHDDVQIDLTLYVTNLPSGSVNFNVSDSIGRQIPDANIILLNEETYDDYYGSTNSSGNALFTNLTVGTYLYDISSEGTNTLPQRGYLEVEPSPVADEVNINLMMQLGDYQSTLTPVNIEDMYQVTLNGTFETDVPVPIITASPPYLVYSLEPGDEMSGHFKVTNYGLISAYDVSISAVSDEGMTIELLVDNIDNLEARSSVEIPFKIKINDSGIKDVKLKGQFDITSIYVHYVNDKKVASYVGTQVPVYVRIIDDVNLKINPQVIWINSVTDTTNLTNHLPVTYELCEDVLTAQNLETDNNIILSPVFGTSLKIGTGIGTDSIEDIVKGLWIPDGVSAWGGQFDPYVIEPSSTATLDLNKISMDFEILPTSFNLFTVAGEGGILGFSYGKVDLNVSQNDVDNTIPMYYYTERAWIPIVVTSTGYPQSLNDSYIIKQIFSGAKDIVSTVGGIPHAIISIIEDSGNDDNNDGSSSSDYSRTSGTSYIPPDDIEWITIPSTLLIEEPFSIMNETAHVKVKITIPQYVFMEREAFFFDAAVTNKDFNDEWEDVSLDLNIRQNGTIVNDMFFVKTPALSGINAINGSGVLSPSSSATAKWLIIPNTGTGGMDTEGENYTISTTISYSINGEAYEMEMESFKFTVLPSPEMVLNYYIPANVEANEPFKLMVNATNDGYGTANQFSIKTGQPSIYENFSGLLIDFKIIGSRLQGEPRSNSLLIDFGDIDPGESKIATWDMVTTLDGEFTEFTGEYTHDAELGGVATSLIREINTYIIQGSVDGMEESYDYIVTSKLNEEQYTLIDSSSGISRSVKNTNYTLVGNNTSSASLNVSLDTYANEWMIASIDDPFSNEVQIEKVVRILDHSELPVQNSWLSGGKIFLLDYSNGSIDGNYTVKFEQADLQANFSANTTSGFEPLSVQFTDLSTDAETWAWDFGDGFNVSGTPAPTHVYVDNGVYNVTLTVTDEDGEIETDTLKITVNNVAPVCDAGSNQLADEGDVVSFFGNYSDNGTADTHTIVWDFGDGFNVSDVLVPTHVYADNGVYNVTLIVIDDDGGIGTDTLEVTVNNVAPVCVAGSDQLVNEGDIVSFLGNYSDSGTFDTHTIVWDFGDGSNSSDTLTPEHVYSDDGTYNVTLAVIDDDGGIGTDTLEVIVLSSGERIVTVNLQDSLGLPLTGGIVTYYDGGWQEFGTTDEYGKVSKQLPVGNYNFRTFYNHASNTKYQNIGTNSTVIFSTVDASVELRDSSGYLLDNGSVQYYSGGWYDFGTFVNGSSHMELLPNNYNFRMNYGHASNTKYQNIGTNSTVIFSTVDASVELRDSSGYLLDNGSVQYYSGGWYDFGTFVNGSSHMELLPNNYNFRMNYDYASNTKYQNIGTNSTVIFSTVDASVELRDSSGCLLDNGSVQYYSGGWYDFGTFVNGSSHMELLPNNYNFRTFYNHASNTRYQNIGTNSTVVFSTVDATVELRNSSGNLLNNGSVQYYSGGWYDLGTFVNGSSHMELLPNNYNFRMNYDHASNTRYQDIGTNSTVVFSTVDTTVELRDSNGNLLNNGSVQYYSGGWYDFGTFVNGISHMELLPNNYNFRMNYGHASNTMYQDIGTNSTVVFLTGKIISDSGTCTQYYSGGWQVFTNGMELLSGSYNFRFNDGTSDGYYSIEAGTVNTIY